jgi:hypothetical protein
VQKSIHTVGGGTDVTNSNLTGIADLELAGRYALWNTVSFGARRVQELAVSLGTAAPTGSHNAKMEDGTLLDPHGQIGIGGWGPLAGVHYRFEQANWLAFASVGDGAHAGDVDGAIADGPARRRRRRGVPVRGAGRARPGSRDSASSTPTSTRRR